MGAAKRKYIEELERLLRLKGIKNAVDILQDYQQHIEDAVYSEMLKGFNEQEAITIVLNNMPTPKEIVRHYENALKFHSEYHLMIGNYTLFLSALVLTFFHYYTNLQFIDAIWEFLIELKWVLLYSYALIWIVLGYTFGKVNGIPRKKPMRKITLLAITPNYLFMIFILFGFQEGWSLTYFDFLEQSSLFLIMCMIMTLAFYPLSRWGFKQGIIHDFSS
ncbi:hypothetical protein [Bacillus massiliigorillae]|uniref:hypothetical protein n=1 Tax=Bacillus massiliigorillae TaxID=1243664 RepID=UPI0003A30DF9|nr:hypothetical protein [Bacillus massiliigorillae]